MICSWIRFKLYLIFSEGLRSLVGDVNNLPSWYTPIRKQRSLDNSLINCLLSPEPIHLINEHTMDNLNAKDESLKTDIKRSRAEADRAVTFQKLEIKVRRNTIKMESNTLLTMEEANVAHRKGTELFQCKFYMLQATQDWEQVTKHQLIKLKDETDSMQNAKEKLVETEELFRKCREGLDKHAYLRECLK
jgi:hypothetical protein